MTVAITKITDNSTTFDVEFIVTNTYKRAFPVRPQGFDQMQYARAQVETVVPGVVEQPAGVLVVQPAPQAVKPDTVIDLTPVTKAVVQTAVDVAAPVMSDALRTILTR